MPRIARIVIAGVAHHITQRGNNRQDVFFVEDDWQVNRDLLHGQCLRYGFTVTGYCLMTNHIHIIGTPETEAALAKASGRTHFLYTQSINKMHARSGHLWQNRFYSCPMDDAHALQALSYGELNPVRAGSLKTGTGNAAAVPVPTFANGLYFIVYGGGKPHEKLSPLSPPAQGETGCSPFSPCDYPWSCAAAHCGSETYHPVLNMEQWRTRMPHSVWCKIPSQFTDYSEAVEALRRHTHMGRPLGSDSFLSKLEHLAGHRLRQPWEVRRAQKIEKNRRADGKW